MKFTFSHVSRHLGIDQARQLPSSTVRFPAMDMSSTDSEASPVKILEERPRRSRKVPAKLRDTLMELEARAGACHKA